MLELFIPSQTRRLILYPSPINVRWGPDRLRAICERELGVTLDRTTAVVFHNRAQDTLVLYTLDDTGDRCILKKISRGVFLLPVPAAGEKYAIVKASKVATLFRA